MMKRNTILILFFAAFLFIGGRANAQDYQTAVGLKFGYESGPTVKYFLSKDAALEGMLGFRSNGVVITGLYQKHLVAFDVPNLKFYFGYGAHLGAIGKGTYKRFNGDAIVYDDNKILLGADGVVGLEYVVPNSPIGISIDLNPRLELGNGAFFDIAPGLGLKYIF